jgi:solute carrier family 25, member 39/40
MASSSSNSSQDVSISQKMISASFGAMITSLVTTPLEVVKTRMQVAVSVPGFKLTKEAVDCIHYKQCKNSSREFLEKQCTHAMREPHSQGGRLNAIETLFSVVKNEGVRTLWSGLKPSLVMAIPTTTLYFTLYDELRDFFKDDVYKNTSLEPFAPLLAGIIGRSVTVTIVSPLELIRTRAMAMKSAHSSSNPSIFLALRDQLNKGGVASLWRGYSATLWRDVIFSGIYWSGYEFIKDRLHGNASDASFSSSFMNAFLAGFFSGSFAAFVTTPFDVVKTRRQTLQRVNVSVPSSSVEKSTRVSTSNMIATLRSILKTEGIAGLFAGVQARVARVGPACAIMISSFEAGKLVFKA